MPALPRILSVLMLTLILPACSAGDQPQVRRSATPSPTASASPSADPQTAVRSTYFGSHDHDPVGTWPDGPVGSLRAWDAGVTWREIEVAPGNYDFSRLDAMVDTAEQHDSDVLLVLGQTPAFHALDPTAESFYGEGASSPPKLLGLEELRPRGGRAVRRTAGRPSGLERGQRGRILERHTAADGRPDQGRIRRRAGRPTSSDLGVASTRHPPDRAARLDRRLLRHLGRGDAGGGLRRRRVTAALPGRRRHAGDVDGPARGAAHGARGPQRSRSRSGTPRSTTV